MSAAMTKAVASFLDSLDDSQRTKAVHPALDDPARTEWHYAPRRRPGIGLAALDARQQMLLRHVLATGLSIEGFSAAVAIVALEAVLGEVEGNPQGRDPLMYHFIVYGTPGDADPWAWRFEGHHLSVHYTLAGGHVVARPHFFGDNPHHLGPLGPEESLARDLLLSLDSAQRADAVVDAVAPDDILTTAQAYIDDLPGPAGVPSSALNGGQRDKLTALLTRYASRLPPGLNEIPEEVSFAWAGSERPGEGHYYRLMGDDLLIEYDNTQNGADHAHTVWRQPSNDFGRTLLSDHHSERPH